MLTNDIADWVEKNPGAVTCLSVGLCVLGAYVYANKRGLISLSPLRRLSYFNLKNYQYVNKLKQYTQTVTAQGEEINLMRYALAECVKRLRDKHNFLQEEIKLLRSQNGVRMLRDFKDREQASLINHEFNRYPVLPLYRLTNDDIERVLNERIKHHEKMKQMVEDFLAKHHTKIDMDNVTRRVSASSTGKLLSGFSSLASKG